ncbi:MAG: hypothetical protein ACPGEF_06685, partial [Endozoicomonas sp.]
MELKMISRNGMVTDQAILATATNKQKAQGDSTPNTRTIKYSTSVRSIKFCISTALSPKRACRTIKKLSIADRQIKVTSQTKPVLQNKEKGSVDFGYVKPEVPEVKEAAAKSIGLTGLKALSQKYEKIGYKVDTFDSNEFNLPLFEQETSQSKQKTSQPEQSTSKSNSRLKEKFQDLAVALDEFEYQAPRLRETDTPTPFHDSQFQTAQPAPKTKVSDFIISMTQKLYSKQPEGKTSSACSSPVLKGKLESIKNRKDLFNQAASKHLSSNQPAPLTGNCSFKGSKSITERMMEFNR